MTPTDKFLLFVATPAVLLFALLEGLVLVARRRRYDWRACGVSVLDLLLRIGLNLALPLSLGGALFGWAIRHRVATIPLGTFSAVAVLFIGQEFCYYWYHRAAHRVRWFWGNHSVHHSSNELNLSAALRIGIFGKLSGTALFFVPLIWLGFDARTVFSVLSINLLYQFWIHATWIPKLGWLEMVLNTPSAHRVHHAANPEYLDANYGGVLIVFDRLFGTYTPERVDLPCRYGLVHPLRSNNLLKVELTEWQNLLRDLVGARSLRAVLGHLLMPPGWAPDGTGLTTEVLRAQARAAAGAGATAAGAVAGASAAPVLVSAAATPP